MAFFNAVSLKDNRSSRSSACVTMAGRQPLKAFYFA